MRKKPLPVHLTSLILLGVQEAAGPRGVGKKDDVAIAPLLDRPDNLAELAVRIASELIKRLDGDRGRPFLLRRRSFQIETVLNILDVFCRFTAGLRWHQSCRNLFRMKLAIKG